MPNQGKRNEKRFWDRWAANGSVTEGATIPEKRRKRVIAAGVVDIPQCGLYVKTPLASLALMQQLAADGYEDDTHVRKGETKPKHYRFMKLRDDVLLRKGKCGSCKALISVTGIASHKHACEACGAFTYVEYRDGGTVRFRWLDDEGGYRPSLKMKVFDYDDETKCLLLYPEPIDGDDCIELGIEDARESLKTHADQYTLVDRDGKQFIAIPHDVHGRLDENSVINMCESYGSMRNFSTVKLYKGKEYGEYGKMPVQDSFVVHDAWAWAPLKPSPHLHERIISAAGMVSRADYYYQDGRAAFYDIHLERMSLFVQHFTTLDYEAWTRMLHRADKSGPGMIRAIAAFCHPQAQVRNEPNIGNLLHGVSKLSGALRGERVRFTDDEIAGMADALKDKKIATEFSDLLHTGAPRRARRLRDG